MALQDAFSNVHLLVRWLHVMAGITWIGHLYFFNFVNIPMQASLDDATKKAVNPQLMPRALWWFRWGAMITFLAGLYLFTVNYMYTPGAGFGPSSNFMVDGKITGRAIWILMGMLFGTAMWFNVWFIIWPAQQKILGKKVAGEALAVLRTKASKASRMNTFMSGPMLFGMLAPAHYGAANGLTLIIAVTLGMIAIGWGYRHSIKINTTV
ncbi:MAG: antitermination protein NusG [Candidatus Omnitrophica bacterium CG11_big_fil_rev_8_21_14_0_20_45_26]|uniref:Antitermination protein NusG n=1 Tax=Candidatus Abzuiibacterium crystallinum TaxID=1974748 RepID=A0A2H0LN07_9BACT|nr:MAG: antitermination protein NusG [Candidatus Omnitrophica bacterium CG11_big_fil_rev_8_21_14_0_20_45_26]PIW64146.1 MAG: antitermination protein NusG [Candidatus Omnitrophica bacterium CG12_big_fil_rev_8_21_14_0_65_45_16]